MNILKQIVVVVVVAYILFGVYLYLHQNAMIYFPVSYSLEECEGYEVIDHKGTKMLYKKNNEHLVVFYHSNAESACSSDYIVRVFEELNYSYIVPEYTGYGDTSVKPSKKAILQDVQHVTEFIDSLEYDSLILSGWSLGTGIAAYHRTLQNPDKMVLISAYTSIVDIGKQTYFMYPLKILVRENYKTLEWLKGYDGEMLIIHGEEDTQIPFKLGKQLAEELDANFLPVPDVGHGDVFTDEVKGKIKSFLGRG